MIPIEVKDEEPLDATSTPVRTQPTSEMIVELVPETTTGHQAQPKLLPTSSAISNSVISDGRL